MKQFNRIFSLVLTVVLAAGMLCGCGLLDSNNQAQQEALAGVWTRTAADSQEQAQQLLENVDLYEEEIALVDMNSLGYVLQVEFTMENTYRFFYDVEATKTCVREFYMGVFDALYEGRSTLNAVYEVDFDEMSREEFNSYYTELYELEDFTALVDQFTENAYDYESLAEDLETGTYKLVADKILCKITGERKTESLGYKVEDGMLTLQFSDGTHVYKRAE